MKYNEVQLKVSNVPEQKNPNDLCMDERVSDFPSSGLRQNVCSLGFQAKWRYSLDLIGFQPLSSFLLSRATRLQTHRVWEGSKPCES